MVTAELSGKVYTEVSTLSIQNKIVLSTLWATNVPPKTADILKIKSSEKS